MNKDQFYEILNIENPDEFTFYENVASLFEEESLIEKELIFELLKEIDLDVLYESTGTFFEEFLKILPDSETELYILVDSIKTNLLALIQSGENEYELNKLADEIYKFRKWYSLDLLTFDKTNKLEKSIRDARYDLLAAKLLNEDISFDFRLALDYDLEGYDYRLEVEFND